MNYINQWINFWFKAHKTWYEMLLILIYNTQLKQKIVAYSSTNTNKQSRQNKTTEQSTKPIIPEIPLYKVKTEFRVTCPLSQCSVQNDFGQCALCRRFDILFGNYNRDLSPQSGLCAQCIEREFNKKPTCQVYGKNLSLSNT